MEGRMTLPLGDARGRTVFETVLVAIMLFLLLIVAVEEYDRSIKPVKETALSIELSNLRSAVTFFVTVKGRLPADLKELMDVALSPGGDIEARDYTIKAIGGYVESMEKDREGYPMDPFGNRYSYDPSTGMVRSSTGGYQSW